MAWIVRLVKTGADGEKQSAHVTEINRPDDLGDIASLGLFCRVFANRIRRRGPRRGNKWHLDEVVITIADKKYRLWRVVDQEDFVLDVLVQGRRDKKAAKRLFRKLLKKHGRAPRVLITDKLKSHGAAKREIMPGVEHEALQVAAAGARFLSTHDQIANVFSRHPNQVIAAKFHSARNQPFTTWAKSLACRWLRNGACRRPSSAQLRRLPSHVGQLDGAPAEPRGPGRSPGRASAPTRPRA